MSRDTWAGDYKNPITLNKWLYSHGNPILLTDPSGNDPWWCGNDMDCYAKWIADYQSNCGLNPTPTPTPIIGVKLPVEGMTTSDQGYKFIEFVETLPPEHKYELWPYNDTTDTCTIGYGTRLYRPDLDHCGKDKMVQTINNGTPMYYVEDMYGLFTYLPPKKGLSQADAEAFLKSEIRNNIEKNLKNDIAGTSLYQYEFDALVSYLFNTGILGDVGSAVTNYDSIAVVQAMVNNPYKRGKVYDANILLRRKYECAIYYYGDYQHVKGCPVESQVVPPTPTQFH